MKLHVFSRGEFLTNNHAYRRYPTEELLIRRLRVRAQASLGVRARLAALNDGGGLRRTIVRVRTPQGSKEVQAQAATRQCSAAACALVLHLEGEQVSRQGLPDGTERDLFRFSALMRQEPRSLCTDLR